MNRHLRFLIIQLLVAAIVSLGVARAGVDGCPPDCPHRPDAVSIVFSCCDEMGGGSGSGHLPKNGGDQQSSAGCEQDAFCPTGTEKVTAIAAFTSPGLETAVLIPAAASFRPPAHGAPPSAIVFPSPPTGKTPALYTLNCSLLI